MANQWAVKSIKNSLLAADFIDTKSSEHCSRLKTDKQSDFLLPLTASRHSVFHITKQIKLIIHGRTNATRCACSHYFCRQEVDLTEFCCHLNLVYRRQFSLNSSPKCIVSSLMWLNIFPNINRDENSRDSFCTRMRLKSNRRRIVENAVMTQLLRIWW
jgi:hypothetical protein